MMRTLCLKREERKSEREGERERERERTRSSEESTPQEGPPHKISNLWTLKRERERKKDPIKIILVPCTSRIA